VNGEEIGQVKKNKERGLEEADTLSRKKFTISKWCVGGGQSSVDSKAFKAMGKNCMFI